MNRIALLVSVLVSVCGTVLADIAPIAEWGGTTFQPKASNPPITMLWEEVDLYPSLSRLQVKAVFGMKNTSTQNVTLEVGFPVFVGDMLNDFVVTLDGAQEFSPRLVQAQRQDGKRLAVPDPAMPDNTKAETAFGAWIKWKMTFPAGRECCVEVEYWCPPRIDDRPLRGKATPEIRHKLAYCTYAYAVRTGREWAGNIGRGTFRVHWSDEVPKANLRAMFLPRAVRNRPAPQWQYDLETNTDTLVYNDFDPDHDYDIAFTFKRVTPLEEVRILTMALKQGQLGGYSACSNAAMEHLVILIAPTWDRYGRAVDLLRLPEADRKARLIEVLEYCVPPLGPGGFEKDILSGAHGGLTESLIYRAFRTLFAHYQETGHDAKAAALAPHYRSTLEAMRTFCRKELDRIAPGPQTDSERDALKAVMEKINRDSEDLLRFENRDRAR